MEYCHYISHKITISTVQRFTFDHLKDEPNWNKLQVIHSWGSKSWPGIYSEVADIYGVNPKNYSYGKQYYGQQKAFEGICNELLDVIKNTGSKNIYDVVLIDEAQDFPKSFFEIIYYVVKNPKRIVWAYDELQNLGSYSMVPPEELFGFDEGQNPRVTLRNVDGQPQQDLMLPVCYRNTPWALAAAHALGFGIYRNEGLVQHFDDPRLWIDMGYEVLQGDLNEGSKVVLRRKKDFSPLYFLKLIESTDAVQVLKFSDSIEQAKWVAQEIKKNIDEDELELSDILIIFADPVTVSKEAGFVIQQLNKLGINAHIAGITTSKDELFTDDSIAITGIYRAKGNEAPMVYILNSNYCYSGYELIKRRNILFTAITRSRAWVRICGSGSYMEGLKEEVNRVFHNEFKLEFSIPTHPELEKSRRIHRDMTPDERNRIEKAEEGLKKLIDAFERGELDMENIPDDLLKKLKKYISFE